MNHPDRLLCEACLTLLSLVDPHERCPTCFNVTAEGRVVCDLCRTEHPLMEQLAAAFDYTGPAATLVKQCKYHNKPWLAEPLASYLVAQFCLLEWPLPDLIVPAPIPWTHLITRGYNQSALLAKSVARLLGCGYCDALYRASGDYSQAGLSTKQRKQLPQTVRIKKDPFLYDKTILLIDDVVTTGTTLSRCAEALMLGFPRVIYGLAVCRS